MHWDVFLIRNHPRGLAGAGSDAYQPWDEHRVGGKLVSCMMLVGAWSEWVLLVDCGGGGVEVGGMVDGDGIGDWGGGV